MFVHEVESRQGRNKAAKHENKKTISFPILFRRNKNVKWKNEKKSNSGSGFEDENYECLLLLLPSAAVEHFLMGTSSIYYIFHFQLFAFNMHRHKQH